MVPLIFRVELRISTLYICQMEITFQMNELGAAADQLLQTTRAGNVFALHGEMGAGKTTFVIALCKLLQVEDIISSPTFPIINEYQTINGEVIFHIDLYRLNGAREALQAGVEDCLISGNICFVEWPERAPDLFPDGTIHVYFSVIDSQTRRISIVDN